MKKQYEIEVTYAVTMKKTVLANSGDEATALVRSEYLSFYNHLVHKDLPGHSSRVNVKCTSLCETCGSIHAPGENTLCNK